MSRRLKMAIIDTIRNLHKSGHSNREIARVVGIDRGTVAKYLRGDEESNASKSAKPDHRVGPKNACEPFRDLILTKLESGLTGTRIFQDLVDDHGFTASYSSVRRFIQRLGRKSPVPVRRIETAPGEEAQIDFGTGARVEAGSGTYRRPWVFRFVLSYSRRGYSEVVYRQTTDNFIHCLENAFYYFGGVPKTLVIDNLKAAVAKADWYDPLIHPKLQAFANHYGTVILPTKPYKPEHKGKVENGIKYVKSNALQGRTFTSLNAQNAHLLDWEQRIADTRIHGTTKKQVAKMFVEEQPALIPLPKNRFANFHEGRRTVHRDGHVAVEQAFYSVPPEYVGRNVWVRWDANLVRIYDHQFAPLIVHAKVQPGQFQTASEHIPWHKVSAVERNANTLLSQLAWVGPQTQQWSEAVVQARGVAAIRVLIGLKSLTQDHANEAIEKACKTALSYGAYRLQTIRQLLKRQPPPQQAFEFLEEHPIIRPLKDYSLDSILQFRKERP